MKLRALLKWGHYNKRREVSKGWPRRFISYIFVTESGKFFTKI
jgi:hypothetical protein